MSYATLPERHAPAARTKSAGQTTVFLIVLWSFLGLAIRIAAARSDLWLDEIWNIRLLERTSSSWDILFALPYDSNHLLNSLWLNAVGPDASPMIARLASIVEGSATIPLTALLVRRYAPQQAWIASAFVALSLLFVQFGSEARGYAAVTVAMIAALICLEACVEPTVRRSTLGLSTLGLLASAIAFGTLSHLIMIAMSGILFATAFIRLAAQDIAAAARMRRLTAIGVASFLGTLPAATAWFISISRQTSHIGNLTPWSWTTFALGLGRITQATFGLPLVDRLAVPAMLFGIVVTLVGLVLVPSERRVFPTLAILGLPALQALWHVPNEEYARFHLVTGLALALLAIDATIVGVRRTGMTRIAAILFAILVGLGQSGNLVEFLAVGRGAPVRAVAAMTAQGASSVIVEQNWNYRETKLVIDWAAVRQHVVLEVQPPSCPGHSAWLIRVDQPGGDTPAPSEINSPANCATRYRLYETMAAYGLSGFTWHLYRRAEPAPPS